MEYHENHVQKGLPVAFTTSRIPAFPLPQCPHPSGGTVKQCVRIHVPEDTCADSEESYSHSLHRTPEHASQITIDRKSLFRRLGHSPRKVVLESLFTAKVLMQDRIFVKVGGLPVRGMLRAGRCGAQTMKHVYFE